MDGKWEVQALDGDGVPVDQKRYFPTREAAVVWAERAPEGSTWRVYAPYPWWQRQRDLYAELRHGEGSAMGRGCLLVRGNRPVGTPRQLHQGDPCPRCGEPLLGYSPSGQGTAACDHCGIWFGDEE
jgi:hypothetical protein